MNVYGDDFVPLRILPRVQTGQLSEDTKVGQVIHTLEAFDKDTGENGKVQYVIGVGGSVGSRNLFSINPLNGQLTLSSGLDRESRAHHEFSVLAVDNGSPQMTSSVLVSIRVDDVNDNAPIFTASNILVSVQENAPIKTLVSRFEATEPFLRLYFIFCYKKKPL